MGQNGLSISQWNAPVINAQSPALPDCCHCGALTNVPDAATNRSANPNAVLGLLEVVAFRSVNERATESESVFAAGIPAKEITVAFAALVVTLGPSIVADALPLPGVAVAANVGAPPPLRV